MKLDARGFGAAQLLGIADVMDMAVLDGGENPAHTAHDTGLFTVMNVAAADDMASHILLQPAVVLAAAYGIPLHLGGTFYVFCVKIHIIFRVAVFAQRDSTAFAVADLTVLDDPALAPVRADHAVLVGGRRRPGGGGLLDIKAADSNIAYTGLVGHEAVAAHTDLDLFAVGIGSLEICVQDCDIPVLLGIPFKGGFLLVPCTGVCFSPDAFLQGNGFVHHQVVHENSAGMTDGRGKVPVAADIGGIGIVGAEYTVVHPCCPYIILIMRPAGKHFGTGDDSSKRLFRAIDDTVFLCTGVDGIYIFTIDPGRYQDFVSRHGDLCSLIDAAERHFLTSVSIPGSPGVYIIDCSCFHFVSFPVTRIFCL